MLAGASMSARPDKTPRQTGFQVTVLGQLHDLFFRIKSVCILSFPLNCEPRGKGGGDFSIVEILAS